MPYYSNPITSSVQKMVINLLKSLQQNLQDPLHKKSLYNHYVDTRRISFREFPKMFVRSYAFFEVNKFKHLVKVKKITIDLTNPYFMSATFRTCFFSPFSNLNDEKVTLRLIEVQV